MASTLVVCVEHLHKYMKTDWYNCYLSLPFFLPLKLSKSMFLRLYCSFRSIGWTGRNNLPMFSLLTVQRVDRKEHLEEIKAAWEKKGKEGGRSSERIGRGELSPKGRYPSTEGRRIRGCGAGGRGRLGKEEVQDNGPVVADAWDAVAVGNHAVGKGREAVDEEVVDGAVAFGLGEIGEGVGFGHGEHRARGLHLQSRGLDAPQARVPVTAGEVVPCQLPIDLTHSAFHDFPLPAGMDVDDADALNGAGLPEDCEGMFRCLHRVAHEDRMAYPDAHAAVPVGYVSRHRRQDFLQADDVGIDVNDHPGHRFHPPAPVVLPRFVAVAGPFAHVEGENPQAPPGEGGGRRGGGRRSGGVRKRSGFAHGGRGGGGRAEGGGGGAEGGTVSAGREEDGGPEQYQDES